MMTTITALLLVIGLVVLVFGGLQMLKRRAEASPGSPIGALFKAKTTEARLRVVEQISIDGKRQLVLIRRDDVEHLVMTGGPTDVVIETGIKTESSGREGA